MKNIKHKLVYTFIISICFCFFNANSQTNFWFFGDHAGLDFSSGSPVAITGQSVSDESSSAVSNPVTGELLFYTNGITVWDKNHAIMQNGMGLMGHQSSAMGALIVPQPSHSNIYYLFTADAYQNTGANGFRYSIVDMNANGGNGAVISKNNLLFAPCAEVNHAVLHANCTDYWIIARSETGNTFYLYQLTANGILPPIINTIGLPTSASGWGQSKFSPDGKKFATNFGRLGMDNYLQLFDFDNYTGLLSNPIILNYSNAESMYGLSFSPNNTKLYASMGNTNSTIIYQWDVSLSSVTAIIASKTLVGIMQSPFPAMQIGKDFKIYISADQYSYLSTIENPNLSGGSCNVLNASLSLIYPTTKSYFGLPIFPENYFDQSNPNIINSTSSDTTIDYGSSVQLFVNGSGAWIQWYPTDNLSCNTCSTTIATPSETTTYTVSYNDGVHCPAIRNITVNVDYKPQIPNVFTPNNDGVNDFFYIKNLPPSSKIKIYNRWGNLIYHSDSYANNWTTNVNGTYYYILEIKSGKTFKGFVEVF